MSNIIASSQLQREGMTVFNGAGLSFVKNSHAYERLPYCLVPTAYATVPQHMADEVVVEMNETDVADADVLRIYEIGYHIIPTVKEEDLEKVVGDVRSTIEREGGSFIAEGAPSMMKLSYPMSAREGDRRVEHDRAYFGWIKFEAGVESVSALSDILKPNPNFLRFVIFKTVREDTRAKMKAPTLREVKRTDTIKSAPRRAPTEESSAPVSEVDLEKALLDITTE